MIALPLQFLTIFEHFLPKKNYLLHAKVFEKQEFRGSCLNATIIVEKYVVDEIMFSLKVTQMSQLLPPQSAMLFIETKALAIDEDAL